MFLWYALLVRVRFPNTLLQFGLFDIGAMWMTRVMVHVMFLFCPWTIVSFPKS